MSLPDKIDLLTHRLPDEGGTRRFFVELSEKHPAEAARAVKNEALLSDLLTLAAFSPLLATTILQNPSYIQWLARERTETKVRSKEELLESLARFALTNSAVEPHVLLARFRRRELLRIYLRDIRRLATVTEITEELSNLADTILEFALRSAKQELDNRYGAALEPGDKGRLSPAAVSIVAVGKLGSKELNYSSDIDLLFLYSAEGSTSGQGTRGSITNREYFIKLAEQIIGIVGRHGGEGAAYRIDLRLRPRGTIGALALSLEETVRYYRDEARDWERQVLIRSRSSAGEPALFRDFFDKVRDFVFEKDADVEKCLASVRRSKQQIDARGAREKGYNVKLGLGGIREIEFIAQALQLAYGGRDEWLRFPHTLVSLSRLADRDLIKERELTELYEAYYFHRRLEHRLQMENGLQTHTVPNDPKARWLVAARMGFDSITAFDNQLKVHSADVHRVYSRVFGLNTPAVDLPLDERVDGLDPTPNNDHSGARTDRGPAERFADTSPYFSRMIAANPAALLDRVDLSDETFDPDYRSALFSAVETERDFGDRLGELRRIWSELNLRIAAADLEDKLTFLRSKALQTELAEASIDAALAITDDEMSQRPGTDEMHLSVLGLGKLGGRGIDYGSDLDLVMVYEDRDSGDLTAPEFYSRAVEVFVTTLSGMTREGNLYRVDLRLRPYGTNGASATSRAAFVDYFQNTATVWELLAFVKLRGVAGEIADDVESKVREIIHRRALETDADELRSETARIRSLLERQKAGRRKEIDIKYGPGGMLDVYFATRYLQLRDNLPDDRNKRSTLNTLDMLRDHASLDASDHEAFSAGYLFLLQLDHNIRLTTGRSTRLPADQKKLRVIASRMALADEELIQMLTVHRLNIRNVFDRVVGRI